MTSEWLDNATWPTAPLGRLFRIVGGSTPTSEDHHWGGDISWVTPVDLRAVHGGCVGMTTRSVTERGVRSAGLRLLPEGSIVLSCRAPIGYVAVADRPVTINQGCKGLVPLSELDTRFFRYQLQAATAELASLGRGSTFFELASNELAGCRLTSPPVDAQRRVADFLDAETARMDTLIKMKLQAVDLFREREISLISSAFGRELQLRNGTPHGIQGWNCVPLGLLAQVRSGLALNEAATPSVGDVTSVPYLRVANVQDGWLDLTQVKKVIVERRTLARWRLRPGDVLMTEGGDPDKLGRGTVWVGAIDPCLHQNHVFAVRPSRAEILPEYLTLVTRTSYARAYFEMTASKTTGIASTSASRISAFRVPMVELERQRHIVGVVSEQLGLMEQARETIRRQIALLHERRQALITAAVTGQIEV